MYKVVMGLHNPEKKYDRTWHSIGGQCLKTLASDNNMNFNTYKEYDLHIDEQNKFIYFYSNHRNINDSGHVLKLLHYKYKFNIHDVIVLHDEAMLDVGFIRITHDGSPKGHNGLRNIIHHFGSNFYRVKIGVGHPGRDNDLSSYLLTTVRQEEWQKALDVFNHSITLDVLHNIHHCINKKFG